MDMDRLRNWVAPASFSMNLHNVESLSAKASSAVPGGFHIYAHNEGYETFSLTIFTDNDALARDLAEAMNAVIAKHKPVEMDDACSKSAELREGLSEDAA